MSPAEPLLLTGHGDVDEVKLDDTLLTRIVIRAVLPAEKEVLIDLVAATHETEAEALRSGAIIRLRRADSANDVIAPHELQDQRGHHQSDLVGIVVIKAPGRHDPRLRKATVQCEDAASRGVRECALDHRGADGLLSQTWRDETEQKGRRQTRCDGKSSHNKL